MLKPRIFPLGKKVADELFIQSAVASEVDILSTVQKALTSPFPLCIPVLLLYPEGLAVNPVWLFPIQEIVLFNSAGYPFDIMNT